MYVFLVLSELYVQISKYAKSMTDITCKTFVLKQTKWNRNSKYRVFTFVFRISRFSKKQKRAF